MITTMQAAPPPPAPAGARTGAAVELRGLGKHYDGVVAVDDLTVDIRPGRVTGFLGPNGSGKSTTMRMILGLDRPSSGTVRIGGRRYQELREPLRTVGALLDARAVHPARTAAGHLEALAAANGLPRHRVAEVLGQVGLDGVAGRRTRGFSLGMLQRLGVAGALLGDPEVLLFDEPVNGLDPEGIRWIRRIMRELAGEGRTVLVSSHLMAEMALTADQVIVIGRGRLIADAPVAELVRSAGGGRVEVALAPADPSSAAVAPGRAEAFARRLAAAGAHVEVRPDGSIVVSGADAAAVGRLAAAEGVPLARLAEEEPSLEDVFMNLTSGSVVYSTRPAATVAGAR